MKFGFRCFASLLLCFIVALVFVGCNEQPLYFDISVNVWYSNYGTAYGGGTYQESSICQISATPKQSSQFLGWMHNDVIVSYDINYSFNVNNETSGTYTAIFTCPDMELVTPTNAQFNYTITSTLNISALSLQLSMGSSYDNLHELINIEEIENSDIPISETVLALSRSKLIIIEMNLTIFYETTIDNEVTPMQSTSKTYCEISLQDLSTGILNLNMPTGIDGTATIEISFQVFNGAPINDEI